MKLLCFSKLNTLSSTKLYFSGLSSFTHGFDKSPSHLRPYSTAATPQPSMMFKSCQNLLCTVLYDSNSEAGCELCSQRVFLCSKSKGGSSWSKIMTGNWFQTYYGCPDAFSDSLKCFSSENKASRNSKHLY